MTNGEIRYNMIKWGVLLITVLASFFISAQPVIYKMKMNVLETELDLSYYTQDTTVIWGIYEDTVCFNFNYKIRCYFPLSNEVRDNIEKDKALLFQQYIGEMKMRGHLTYILQDRRKEIYSIVFVLDKETKSLLIFVTNIDYGYPHYVFNVFK